MGEDSPTARKNGTEAGSTQEGTGGDGMMSGRWRNFSTVTSDQRRRGRWSGLPEPEAVSCGAASTGGSNEREMELGTLSGRFLVVVWIFSARNGDLL
jgi:hypothetical protein